MFAPLPLRPPSLPLDWPPFANMRLHIRSEGLLCSHPGPEMTVLKILPPLDIIKIREWKNLEKVEKACLKRELCGSQGSLVHTLTSIFETLAVFNMSIRQRDSIYVSCLTAKVDSGDRQHFYIFYCKIKMSSLRKGK